MRSARTCPHMSQKSASVVGSGACVATKAVSRLWRSAWPATTQFALMYLSPRSFTRVSSKGSTSVYLFFILFSLLSVIT